MGNCGEKVQNCRNGGNRGGVVPIGPTKTTLPSPLTVSLIRPFIIPKIFSFVKCA